MALLHYAFSQSKIFGFNVIALNVEHGIRGKDSLIDTAFVKDFCAKSNIPCVCYSVDSLKKAKEENLSVEESARILRYKCFFDAINTKKCDLVATAHHLKDNAESVLFNLFRGTGIKGVTGITQNFENKIIRPFLSVKKEDIDLYIKENSIPFVVDQTNFCNDYTRNYIRQNVLPQIKAVFPEVEKSISKFSEIAKLESDFIESEAEKILSFRDGEVFIPLSAHQALINRALIIALKTLGIEKDWEKVHLDSVSALYGAENGKKISLPKGVTAIREYDKICLFKQGDIAEKVIPFGLGEFDFGKNSFSICKAQSPVDLKSGLYFDGDKIPSDAVFRFKRDGDVFTKFGGGSKSLSDFLTDKKIPLRTRGLIPVLAHNNEILAIVGIAISDKIKIDGTTVNILKFN